MPHDEYAAACAEALLRVQEFLHGEMSEAEADVLRHHLDACDQCLGVYDVEQVISQLIRRCQPSPCASNELRMRIVSMSMTLRQGE